MTRLQHKFYCVNASTGTLIWSFTAYDTTVTSDSQFGTYSTAAVDDDRRMVYVSAGRELTLRLSNTAKKKPLVGTGRQPERRALRLPLRRHSHRAPPMCAETFNYPHFPRFFSIFSRFPLDFWLCSLDSWRPDGENGRKMGENG